MKMRKRLRGAGESRDKVRSEEARRRERENIEEQTRGRE